jgi:threonine dehydratase
MLEKPRIIACAMAADTRKIPDFSELLTAHERIQDQVTRTAVINHPGMDAALHCSAWLKCENQQRTGAFKLRGASYAVARLRDAGIDSDVATHSSGNHGAALALAARNDGRTAHVVMPSNAVPTKIAAVRNNGGKVVLCEPGQAPRERGLQQLVNNGLVPIPPYDHTHVMAGQGTAAIELIEDAVEIDHLIAPVGGGTLLAGSAIAAQAMCPGVVVHGAEPAGAADTHASLRAGVAVESWEPETIADGLRAIIGPMGFEVIRDRVQDVLLVSEAEIEQAMQLVLEQLDMLIEPSSAVAIAAVRSNPDIFAGSRVGIIISGGNIDPSLFDWLEGRTP